MDTTLKFIKEGNVYFVVDSEKHTLYRVSPLAYGGAIIDETEMCTGFAKYDVELFPEYEPEYSAAMNVGLKPEPLMIPYISFCVRSQRGENRGAPECWRRWYPARWARFLLSLIFFI